MATAIGVIPGRHDLDWTPGASLRRVFTYKVDGVAVDVTGLTVVCQVRDAPGGTLLVDLTSSITVGNTDGKLTLDAIPTLTDDLLQQAVWDLKLVYGDASVDRLLEGRVILDPAVSV